MRAPSVGARGSEPIPMLRPAGEWVKANAIAVAAGVHADVASGRRLRTGPDAGYRKRVASALVPAAHLTPSASQ